MEPSENFSVTNVTKREMLTNLEEEDLAEETALEEEEEDSNFPISDKKRSRAIEIFFLWTFLGALGRSPCRQAGNIG